MNTVAYSDADAPRQSLSPADEANLADIDAALGGLWIPGEPEPEPAPLVANVVEPSGAAQTNTSRKVPTLLELAIRKRAEAAARVADRVKIDEPVVALEASQASEPEPEPAPQLNSAAVEAHITLENVAAQQPILKEALARYARGKGAERERELDRAIRKKKRALEKPVRETRKREKTKARVAKWRAARAVPEETIGETELRSLLEDLPLASVSPETLASEAAAVNVWMRGAGRAERSLRTKEKERPGEIIATRHALLLARIELGSAASCSEMARRFKAVTGRPWSREQARRRVTLLEGLEATGGCWQRYD